MAYRANINRSYIGEIERGEKSPSVDSLEKIVLAFEMSFEELFKYIQPASREKDYAILSLLVNNLNTYSNEEQKIILDFFELLNKWKQK